MTSTSAPSHLRPLGTWMAVRGGLAVVFGLVTVFWPREQIGSPANLNVPVPTVDAILLGYLVLSGLLVLVQGLLTRTDTRTVLLGQAVVVLPGIVFLLLADVSGELRAAIAVWALLHGLLELWMWRQGRDERMSSDFLIVGGIHVLLGVILFAGTDMNALSVMGFTGAAAMIAGVFYLVGGYSRRSRTQGGAVSADEADEESEDASGTERGRATGAGPAAEADEA